jgi:predicted lipoprotein with Yx(FWY)xxD motif
MHLTKALAPLALIALLGMSACGGDDAADEDGTTATTQAPVVTDAPTTTAAAATPPTTVAAPAGTDATLPAAAPVIVSESALGQILTDADGMVLYGFTNDVDGTSTCTGGCADAWPPLIVDASLDLSTLPDTATFGLVDRGDGTMQLKAGDWPLYYFAGDAAAGDTNGQGSGGVWFVVAPDGSLIK